MAKRLKFVLLSALILSVWIEEIVDSASISRFRDVKCSTSNKTTSVKCLIKAYSRNAAYLNILGNFHKPLHTAWVTNLNWQNNYFLIVSLFKVNYTLALRSVTTQYRTLINVSFDACKFFNGTDSNPAAKWLMSIAFQKLSHEVFHACPFIVRIKEFIYFINCQYKFSGSTSVTKHFHRHEFGFVAISRWNL